jgi:predicted nucleotidyltransferase component of viral defense system
MISSGEIRDIATKYGVRQDIIEKDYVLGWVLAGIYNSTTVGNWIFKGGTALKKCYFYDYRFSEDLDFSLQDEGILEETRLRKILNEITKWVGENSGIEIEGKRSIVEVLEDRNKRRVAQLRVYYHGPVSPTSPSQWGRIKLDLTSGEVLTDSAAPTTVHHPYSDSNDELFRINCYSFTELFAEKLRALIERSRPRDLYDVVKCYESNLSDLDNLRKQFKAKMDGKSIKLPEKVSLLSQIQNSRIFWEEQLSHQIRALEDFGYFEERIIAILDEVIYK